MSHSAPLGPGEHWIQLEHDGRQRTALVFVPPGYDPAQPSPLVLAYHGGGTHAVTMCDFSGLNEKATTANFIVVYPNGTGRRELYYTFNGGNCCGFAARMNVDDVGFTAALLDHLQRRLAVDRCRVHATGMSNGAVMSYRVAIELSDRIASIAPVAGPMGCEQATPSRPVSVVHFHGTADEWAPYGGGVGERSQSRANFFSVEHTIGQWVRADGCTPEPIETLIADEHADGMPVRRLTYANGRDRSEVILYIIENGGHTWPGREPHLASLGPFTRSISANDLLWEFFERHPMT